MISKQFLKNTKEMPPNRLLLEALPYVKDYNNALDLGCGAFRDTRFLLEKGFEVDAVDKSLDVAKFNPADKKLNFFTGSFSEFLFVENKYDLVNAQYSLPFCSSEDLKNVWQKIIYSLKPCGVFTGQFFGVEDGFAPDKKMVFFNRMEVEEMFHDFRLHTFVEAKRTSNTVTGRQKFWHIFDVIGEKKLDLY